ncbi:MAG: GNAT family N-acetyltransferase [Clostridia bacterium]|nr:GNAT family N-acetyltransferase [Clostridia bacterium]
MGLYNGYDLGFRGLDVKDFATLEKWYRMTDHFGYATGFKDFSEIRQRLLKSSSPQDLISMIDIGQGNDAVGFVYGEVKTVETKTVLWIYIIIIDPVFQRKGLGSQAIKQLLQFARQKYGPLTCIVAVSERNIKGLMFWERMGFTRSQGMEESLSQNGTAHVAIMKRVMK